jgi:Mor family transcriptional regulator
VYCPKTIDTDRAERDAAIRRDFNGRNRDELCREHGISKSRLYQIVGEIPAAPLKVGLDAT